VPPNAVDVMYDAGRSTTTVPALPSVCEMVRVVVAVPVPPNAVEVT